MKFIVAFCCCFSTLSLLACSSTATQTAQPLIPVQTAHPGAISLLKAQVKPEAPKSKFNINSSPKIRPSASYKSDLIQRGILSIELGDLAIALECANALWRSLEEERARSSDADLSVPTLRNSALLLALAQARTSRNVDTSLLEKILRTNPNWEPAYVVLASILIDRGAYFLAERTTSAALDRVENPSAVIFSLHASALRAQNKTNDAHRTIARATRLFPNETILMHWQALFEYDNGKLDKACELFERAFQKEHAHESLTHNQAVCLSRAGRWDEAVTVIKQALAEFPQSSRIRLLGGTILRKSGDTAGAEQAWRGFLDLSPDNDKRLAI
jgi:Flp pilus assembly protein TadD